MLSCFFFNQLIIFNEFLICFFFFLSQNYFLLPKAEHFLFSDKKKNDSNVEIFLFYFTALLCFVCCWFLRSSFMYLVFECCVFVIKLSNYFDFWNTPDHITS